MNRRSLILSILAVALAVLLCSRSALSSVSSKSKDNAPEVEFRLEKLSDSEYPEGARDAGIMHTITENLYAAKDAISSKITELTGSVPVHHRDSSSDVTADKIKYRAAEVADKASAEAKDAKNSVYDTLRETGDKINEMMQDAKAKVVGASDSVNDNLQDAKHKVKRNAETLGDKAEEARDRVAANLESAKDATKARLYEAKDATVDAKDRTVDKSNELMSDAYRNMKDAYEALAARMNLARDRAADTAESAKDKVKSTVASAGDKADELKSDAKAKYHETRAKTVELEEEDRSLYANAYNRMKAAFDELESKFKGQKAEVKAELYENEAESRGKMAEWYYNMKHSFDTLGDRVNRLTTRTKTVEEPVVVVEEDVESRGRLNGMMTDLYNKLHNAYQGTTPEVTKTTVHNYRTESVDNKETIRDKIQDAKEYIQDLYHGTKNEAQDKYHDAKNEIKDQYHDAKNDAKDVQGSRSRTGELLDDAKIRLQTVGDRIADVGDRIADAVGVHRTAELEGECVNRGKEDPSMCTARTSAEAAKAGAKAEALHEVHPRK